MATMSPGDGIEAAHAELARLGEAGHGDRVGALVGHLCGLLGMDEAESGRWAEAAGLHDMGKLGVPREVLDKPGALGPAEWREVRRHCEVGHRLLLPLSGLAASMALHHHENWDGSGYPAGLSGRAIPLEGRVVRICDVYDALRSERPYKPGHSHEEALRTMLGSDARGGASTFDPDLLDLVRRHGSSLAQIWEDAA